MEAAVERVIRAIEALPRDLANEEVASLFAASDRLTARLSSALARIDPTADGAVSVRHWLRSRAERSDHEAGVLVRRAHRLTGCPLVADAWHDGLLSTGQVNAITASVSDRTQPVLAQHEADLVPALAPLSVRATEVVMRQWAAYADALVEAPLRDPSDRSLHLSAGVYGWGEISGHLDPAGTQVVNAALDAATAPDGEGDAARTRGQRRADALVAVARHYLDHADTAAPTRRSRPDVSVVVTLDDLERGSGRSLDGDVLDTAAIGALLCDACLLYTSPSPRDS